MTNLSSYHVVATKGFIEHFAESKDSVDNPSGNVAPTFVFPNASITRICAPAVEVTHRSNELIGSGLGITISISCGLCLSHRLRCPCSTRFIGTGIVVKSSSRRWIYSSSKLYPRQSFLPAMSARLRKRLSHGEVDVTYIVL